MPGKRVVAPFAAEEYLLDFTRQNVVNWNLLYQRALPLSFPFIIPHATWKEKEYYIHHCPANISAEIVLEGSLQFTLEDGTRILRANELIFLPIGEPNRICTGAEGFTRKAVFGIRGFLAEPILASFSLECGKIYRLQDPGRILQMLSHLVTLYRRPPPHSRFSWRFGIRSAKSRRTSPPCSSRFSRKSRTAVPFRNSHGKTDFPEAG